MYWSNTRSKNFASFIAGFILLLAISSCKSDDSQAHGDKKYFDLKAFFSADSARLAKLNPLVTKTVQHNKTTETKKVHIPNWGTELSVFTESDINRPAWKSSYTIHQDSDFLIYKSKDPALKTTDIIVRRTGDKVKWILIFNYTKNLLYTTEEKLSYFPDSSYTIVKKESVRLLGTNFYKIKGSLR